MTVASHSIDSTLVVIPVRNEAENIATVIASLQQQGLTQIRVIDNGSTDESAAIAQAAGAEVWSEPIVGYGQACWRGLQKLPADVHWILFCDGDGSDDLSQLPQFFRLCDDYDLILGNRRATSAGRSTLTPVQNFGNRLATDLMRLGWNYRYRDLGPLRLIRRTALEQMQMQDRGFGWTIEMQVKAIELRLRISEIPVAYRPRQGGQSKISGSFTGSVRAGMTILSILAQLYSRRFSMPLWDYGAGLTILCGCLILLPYGDFRQATAISGFGVGIAILSLGFLISWSIRQISAFWFWSITLLARLLLLPMYPGNDVWRYLWEGLIQTIGFSPYQLPPNAVELIPYRTLWWSLINHPDVTAIYPPITELGFKLLAAIAPTVLLFKLAFVAADLLTCWLLSRRFGYAKTLLYAWNPLILYSFAGAAHYDSWFILPLVAAWLIFDFDRVESGRCLADLKPGTQNWLGAMLLGISVAVKWISLPLLSFVVWRSPSTVKRTMIAIAGGTPLLLSSLLIAQDHFKLIPTESVFVSHGRSAELVPYLISLVWPFKANWIYLLPLTGLTVGLLKYSRTFLTFSQGFLTGLLLISPIVHAWYFTWLVPFAVASRNWGIRFVSLSAFIYFVLPHRQALGSPNWHLTTLERCGLWLPFVCGWLVTIVIELKSQVRSSH